MRYIFLHGLGQSPSAWAKTLDLAGVEGATCPDLASWIRGRNPCYQTLYQALEKYCATIDEPLALCGLSLGGILALNYGIEHPEKVHSLILIGAQHAAPRRLLKAQNAVFGMLPKSAFAKTGFSKSDFISLCKSMTNLNFTSALEGIRCPTLVLCGNKDRANMAASIEIQKSVPYASFVVIPDAGHEVNIDNPAALGKEIALFQKRNQQPDTHNPSMQ